MSEPRYWREIPQRYRLEAGRCTKCGKVHFPPRLVCASCGGRTFDKYILPDEGRIVTYTIIRVPPAPFKDQAPFAIGIIELMDGVRLMAQIADCDFKELDIGKKVRVEFRKIQEEGKAGILQYGYKFVLA
ncbi:MAG: Zn-ribbon domain-containing OB-fold protein [Acidobacteriota bacterium]